jgi:Arm domain-containing DNA-binding protein
MGLGPARDVSLAEARDAAAEARALIRQRKDPIEARRADRAEAKVQASRAITFQVYAASPAGKAHGKIRDIGRHGATACATTCSLPLAICQSPRSTL